MNPVNVGCRKFAYCFLLQISFRSCTVLLHNTREVRLRDSLACIAACVVQ